MSNPLESLVVDEEEVDQGLLKDVLASYVRIGKDSGKPIFTPDYSKLSENGKILVYLLARTAARNLGLWKNAAEVSPKQISESTGVKYGTAKPALIALTKKGYLTTKDGVYAIAPHALMRIREALK